MSRRRRTLTAFALTFLVATGLSGELPAGAVCGLVPQLRDVTVNQGVGSYARLARGKDAVVRFFLSKPSCADADDVVRLTGGTLTVNGPGGTLGTVTKPTPSPVSTFPPLTPYFGSPAPNSTGDPIFAVPGSVLAPPSTTASFTASFRATLRFESRTSPTATATTGSVTFSQRPGGTAITSVIERKTNALRVLVVPMGDPTRTFLSQFSETARSATQRGMETVSRVFPVPAGISELAGTGGLRYTILPALLDLRRFMVNGRFCGDGNNFNGFKGLLAQFLQTWNSAPTNPPADRVLGVVDAAISGSGAQGCAEGMAAVGETEAWVRAIPSGSPSITGGLMVMELAHSLGLVPDLRDDGSSPFHSRMIEADTTARNRGYNTHLRAFLADDRTAMRISGAWNERTVLLEPADFAFLLCVLGGAAGGCPAPGSAGSSTRVGAEPTFVLSGTTNGSVAGTAVEESYFRLGAPRTRPEPASEYRLVQRDGGAVVRDDGVRVETVGSEHDEAPTAVDEVAIGLFSAAVPFDSRADRIELRRGATVLYARDRNGPPVFANVSVSVGGGAGGSPGVSVVSVDAGGGAGNGPSFSQDASGDGRFVAFGSNASDLVAGDTNGAADVFVRDRTTGTTQRVSVSSTEAQVDGPTGSLYPAISADGRFVAFVSDATGLVAGDTNGAFDVYLRDRTAGTTERVSVTSAETQVTGAVDLAVDISGNGNVVAFTSGAAYQTGDTNGQRDVFVRDRAAGTTTRVSVTGAGAQSPLPAVTGPALNGDGTLVAFATSGVLTGDDTNSVIDVYVRNPTAATTQLVTTGSNGNSSQPSLSADGRFVAFLSSATSLAAGDGNGVADVLLKDRTTGTVERVSVDSSETQLPLPSYATSISSDGRRVAFLYGPSAGSPQVFVRDRPGGRSIPAGGGTDGVEPVLSGNGRFLAFGSATPQFNGDPGGERDVYLRDLDVVPPDAPPGLRDVAVGVSDPIPANVRLDLYYDCGSVAYPVAVALDPSAVTGTTASFATTFDTSRACAGGQLVAVANDGFETTVSDPSTVPDSGDDRPPTGAISTPVAEASILQYGAIPLRGTAKDPELADRVALRWTFDGAAAGTGPVVDLSPPTGGWPPGPHTITLTVTDSAGQRVTETRRITIVADPNNDGTPG